MTIEVTSGPASEPVTLTEAKNHLKVDFTEDDSLISALISAARQASEDYTERSFFTQTKVMYLDSFPDVIKLYQGPFQSVTSIQYYNSDNTLTTFADYRTDLVSKIGRIEPVSSWPSIYDRQNSVIVTYVTGYSTVAAIPELIKQAILLMVGELYDNRQNKVYKLPTWFESLLRPYKVYAEWQN